MHEPRPKLPETQGTDDITAWLGDDKMVAIIRKAIAKEVEYRNMPAVSIVGENGVDIGRTLTNLHLGRITLADAPGFYGTGSGSFSVKLDDESATLISQAMSEQIPITPEEQSMVLVDRLTSKWSQLIDTLSLTSRFTIKLELSNDEAKQRIYKSKLDFVAVNLDRLQDLALLVQSAVRGDLPDAEIVLATDTVNSEVDTIQQWITAHSTI